MRLSELEVKAIKNSFDRYFKSGTIYLFGSRVDDTKKGGDIDLYLDLSYTLNSQELLDKKSKFRMALYEKIGEQKIDIVISTDKNKPIEKEALEKGIKLNIEHIKKAKIIKECDKHVQRLEYASKQLQKIFPLSTQAYENLSEQNIQSIDQFLYRFSKLQDTIGEKLIKLLFSQYEENINKYTFIDILNRLEKSDILSVNQWRELRDIRNELSHNYDDNPQESSVLINKIFAKKETLLFIYTNIKNNLNKS